MYNLRTSYRKFRCPRGAIDVLEQKCKRNHRDRRKKRKEKKRKNRKTDVCIKSDAKAGVNHLFRKKGKNTKKKIDSRSVASSLNC